MLDQDNARYDFSALSLLVVDDNQLIRQLVIDLCRAFGFSDIFYAEDGSSGLGVLTSSRIDIVITDWMMEPISGYELTKRIRGGDRKSAFVPIIMLTGHTERSRIEMARDIGVTEFLAKPVAPKTLVDRLIHVIEYPRPFVRCPSYIGPDRRRRDDPSYNGAERRRQRHAPAKRAAS